MPNERGNVAAAVYQNKIYVIGETDGLNQVYDPTTDTWENRASMPKYSTQIEANAVNGKIYIIGGSSGLTEAYDPANDSWTTRAPMPIAVSAYASAVINNKIYFMGGSGPDIPNLNQIYDTNTDTWSFGAPVPISVSSAQADATSGVLAPKRIYVIGGRTNYGLDGINATQVYNPQNDSWTVGAPMPTARFQLHMTVLNDHLYVMGGLPYFSLGGAYCFENEQYTPIGYEIPTPSPRSPQPQPSEPFSIMWIVATILAIAIVVLVLLVYSKKRLKI
jgi:N-acetylneuraminic acid mutarotase